MLEALKFSGNVKSHAWVIRIFWYAQAHHYLRQSFQYEPNTGNLSTTEEFGSILIGQLDKYLSQNEVQAAIRELGESLEQQSDR
jgi:hypothetical protein